MKTAEQSRLRQCLSKEGAYRKPTFQGVHQRYHYPTDAILQDSQTLGQYQIFLKPISQALTKQNQFRRVAGEIQIQLAPQMILI